ncbi:MAG: DegT/DnrJ/EryC1/StrS family aminotransferase [Desulfobacca sp.]|nr:DegT/DnrJ/EryC1/StrS family aminotransferase [Desulfobacca sp.]
MNIVLDVNVILDLLLKRGLDYHSKVALFDQLRAQGATFWFAACALPSLEYIHAQEVKHLIRSGRINTTLSPAAFARQQLDAFLPSVAIISTLGCHWQDIPPDHPDREDALVSLAAASIPGQTILWTGDRTFQSAAPDLPVYDHLGLKQYLEETASRPPAIPFVNLAAQQLQIRDRVERGIITVLKHGSYIMGPEIKELETKLASYAGVKHAITCSSGTDALLMPLMAYGVGPGDAIFTTPFTFIATAEVIQLLGATPVFVDIDPKTFNIDPKALAEAVISLGKNPRTEHLKPRGVIPVDLFGQPADYDRINAVAQKHGLFVLEDAAQSFGATYKGRQTGSLADVAAISFFPAKPLGCYGDGGAVLTDNDELAAIMRSIRVHGQGTHKYDNVRLGLNGRMDTLQAAIVLAKLGVFGQEITARQEVARRYSQALQKVVEVPYVAPECSSAWAQYSVLSDRREVLQAKLKEAGVPTAIYYPLPLHLQGAFAHMGHKAGDFPVSEAASKRIFSLPMHPYLNSATQEKICSAF